MKPDLSSCPKIYYVAVEPISGNVVYHFHRIENGEGLPSGTIEADMWGFPESKAEEVMARLSEKGVIAVFSSIRDERGDLTGFWEDETEIDY